MPAKKTTSLLKVGILVGREWSWPPAFIEAVNRRNEGVLAEFVKLGGTRVGETCPYRVIVDRISHEVPYYRAYLKNAALQGVKVINDPFMWSADDKFFDASLADRLGIATPKTLALPNKDYGPAIVHGESLRNLMFPLDWNWISDTIGMPCVIKDAHGGNFRGVYVVHSVDELIWRYNQSGQLTMIVQEFIGWENYARCLCLGQTEVYVMKYNPRTRQYHETHDFAPEIHDRLVKDSLTLCQALGYDVNAVEFAIRDGVPYLIDALNPAPDLDAISLGKTHFEWCVTHMADLVIWLAKSKARTAERHTRSDALRDAHKSKA
jgi:hypothetical protein